ncbi:MAG: glycoside hydrolase family 9 protein [Lachnospiraceae bacterium]|nr:glycoside hydrolase family 9 protein [Lachnospiraceae bacterium]
MRIVKYTGLLALTISIFISAGCAGPSNAGSVSSNSSDDGITVSNDALRTDSVILISLAGFEKGGSKTALVKGMKREETFEVIDPDKGDSLFTGEVRYSNKDTEEEETVGILDLTDFDREGTYRIRTGSGVCSDDFVIKQDIYRDILADRISRFGEEDPGDLKLSADNLNRILFRATDRLLAREFFPGSIDKNTADDPMVIPRTVLLARSDMEVLREAADKKGRIKSFLNADLGTRYGYSATMAMYAYIYDKYDKKAAGEYGDLAVSVYQEAEKDYEESKDREKRSADDKRYWASAQLYKLTGRREYKTAAEEYALDPPGGMNEDKCGYLGTVAYLTSYNRIDLNVGELLITSLMEDINDSVRGSFKNVYYADIKELDDETDPGKVYEDARLAVLGNYISKNIKYIEAGENQVAFLYGRNALGKDFAFDVDSQYHDEPMEFILAGLIDSYIYEDKKPEAMER